MMAQTLVMITPEAFDPDIHTLPVAGELLMAGDQVTINTEGIAMTVIGDAVATGWVIEVSRKGDLVEVAAMGEKQDDGGFYFEQICVMQAG